MRSSGTRWLVVFAVGGLLAWSGCLERELKPLNPCTRSGNVQTVRVTSVDKVDLLFMVDNSNSMAEEQTSLAMQFPRLMQVLASGDKNPDDGITPDLDFPAVRSLQVGIVTSDMGTGGFRVPTCAEPNFGDNGVLRTQGNTTIPGCNATYPKFLAFMAGGDAVAFATDVSCVANVGVGGCGFEQQLEATLKAVTSPTQAPVGRFDGLFNMGTSGHAGPGAPNENFLRPDSLLALVLVTDEEDCSALDPELFNPGSSVYSGDLNLRCFSFPAAVHPVERYVDGLLATRNSPDLLVYATISGTPTTLIPPPGEPLVDSSYQRILDDPAMQEMIDPAMPTRLATSCNVAGRGFAFPPRRMVEVARQLNSRGAGGIVQSICQADFSPALNAIIDKIADVLGGACLPRELNPDDTGAVSCEVVEVLPLAGDFTRCDQVPGRMYRGIDAETGGETCIVEQIPAIGGVVPGGAGWYYDNFSADVMATCGGRFPPGQRISFTPGNEPKTGTLVRLECLQPVQSTMGAAFIDIDTPCTPGTDTACMAGQVLGDRTCSRSVVCDPESRTWQVSCNSDAVCAGAGLAGYRCSPLGFCVNPTCGS